MDATDFAKLVKPVALANKTFAKIFVIGFNKTGTTTMDVVLRLYGYSLPDQHEQEAKLSKQFFAGNYAPLHEFVRNYDAFQDMPFSQEHTYIVADTLFPGSKFILTERDPEAWFESMCRFHKQFFELDDLASLTENDLLTKFNYIYEGYVHESKKIFLTEVKDGVQTVRWDMLYNKPYYINKYKQRNDEIKRYFANRPQDLLVIDIEKTQTTEALCEFLNIPVKFTIKMPQMNASEK
jgi:hypothetical protein